MTEVPFASHVCVVARAPQHRCKRHDLIVEDSEIIFMLLLFGRQSLGDIGHAVAVAVDAG